MASRNQADIPTDRPDRRAMLVRAAAELFTERPYDEVTTTEIARRAGVAYGLIAHHFTNKRGLYLATINAGAERLRVIQATTPAGDTPAARLRNGIARHITYIDANATGFLALMRGGNGSDPQVRAIIEDLRWQGALRILHGLGVTEPVRPTLRTAMRGWVGCLDEMIIDHLNHRDIPQEQLVDLAIATLVAALRTAHAIDPGAGIHPSTIDLLTP